MNPEIRKWLDFCEGKSDFDSADFVGLLSARWGKEDLSTIFQYVPKNEEILPRIIEIYDQTQDGPHLYLRPKKENAASSDELKLLAERFVESQRKALLKKKIHQETRKWLQQSDVETVFVSVEEFRATVVNGRNIKSFIFDEEFDSLNYRQDSGLTISTADSLEHRVMSGIEEALFGLDSDYYLAWFVLLPVIDTEVEYGLYFDFWKKGGKYSLTEKQLLVCSMWGQSGSI